MARQNQTPAPAPVPQQAYAQPYAAAPPAPLGGLSLADLATQSMAETQARGAGSQAFTGDVIRDALAMHTAGNTASSEADIRAQTFQRAQDMANELIAQRELAMRAAQQAAQMHFEDEQGMLNRQFAASQADQDRGLSLARTQLQASATPNWYDQQRFQTDENIRQAKALAQMQAEMDAEASTPRVSDFGSETINPYLGQALLAAGSHTVRGQIGGGDATNIEMNGHTLATFRPQAGSYGQQDYINGTAINLNAARSLMPEIQTILAQHPDNLQAAIEEIRRRRINPQAASIVLFDLGVGMGGA